MSSSPAHTPEQARGALAAGLCYFLWGLVPLYWRELAAVDAVELVAHRHLWSLGLLLVLVAVRREFAAVRAALGTPQSLVVNAAGALLLTGNWLCYVWGVNSGFVIETSLGYFLVPLSNIAAGRFILKEQLRRAQVAAIALAATGVAVMFLQVDRPPWIALAIVGTWGGYSLLRKRSPQPAVTSLTIETLLLAPAALAFLVWREHLGQGALGHADLRIHLLLASSGLVTAVPLLLFAYGARRIRLSTLGLLQYVAPSVQLLIGIAVYHEPFGRTRLTSFAFIWAALAVYTADNLWSQRRSKSGG